MYNSGDWPGTHPYKIKFDDLKRVCMLGWQMIKNEHNENA